MTESTSDPKTADAKTALSRRIGELVRESRPEDIADILTGAQGGGIADFFDDNNNNNNNNATE